MPLNHLTTERLEHPSPSRCLRTYSLPTLQHPTLFQLPKQLRLQKLANRNILRKSLPPPRLEHKVARGSLRRRGLERPQLDLLVQRVAGDDGPSVEDEGEGDLALCVDLGKI